MEKKLPEMIEIKKCFEEYISSVSGKFRRRSYSFTTDNAGLLMKPRPPLICKDLMSQSVTLPRVKLMEKEEEEFILPEKTSYKFYCKNISNNLTTIVFPDISKNIIESPTVALFDSDTFDINERIIPVYYINNTGIKVGAFKFNFYESIIDSIRNMRILTVYQIAYLENCSREEYMEIVNEYNNVIQMLNNNNLL